MTSLRAFFWAVTILFATFALSAADAAPNKKKNRKPAAKSSKSTKNKTPAKPEKTETAGKAAEKKAEPEAKAAAVKEAPKDGKVKPAVKNEMAIPGSYVGFHYPYKLNTSFGSHVTSGPPGWGVAVGGQFGFCIWDGHPLYMGPFVDFALFNPGYEVNLGPSIWYEFRIYGAPRLSLHLGASTGASLATKIPGQESLGAVFLLDAAIAQDIGDLATIRGQIRPGIIGRYFAILVNLSVQFRFL